MTSCDVAVVGGGPAGLATAINARLAGMTVRLFDQRRPPIDKACGEGLMPDGVVCLGELGIEASNLGRPFTGIRYLADGLEATGEFPGRAGRGIRRTALHQALVERAQQLGATLHWGSRVTGVDEGTVYSSHGDFRVGWIAAADGLHSRARKWLGIRTFYGRRRFGFRRHFELEPWGDLVEVHWGEGCEAYVTPVDDREIGVAVLRGNDGARFDDSLSHFPELQERLSGARQVSASRGSGPLWSVPGTVVAGRVALVGDAAGYLDAITGEGLSLAFHQSRSLIRAIAAGDLDRYPRSVRRIVRWPARLIRALLYIERRPKLRRRLVRTLANDPALFSRLLAIHSRQLAPGDLGVANAGRLLRGLAIPG